MSGGKFGYQDYNIRIIADHIEEEVIMSGKPIPKQNWDYSMIQHPETAVNPSYEDSTLLRMAEAVYALKKAEIYAHRVDYLLSGSSSVLFTSHTKPTNVSISSSIIGTLS